jgi:signal peptidase I
MYSVLAWLKFSSSFIALLAFFLVPLPYFFYIIIDSALTARKEKNYTLKKYNKWYLYVVILLVHTYILSIPLHMLSPRTYSTPTGSMLNTIAPGERFLANDLAFGIYSPFVDEYLVKFSSPKQGDVISMKFPGYRDEVSPPEDVLYLKRVIALSGDTLVIKEGKVYTNNILYTFPSSAIVDSSQVEDKPDPYIFPKGSGWNTKNYGPLIVPKAGDNIPLNFDNIEKWRVFIEREGNKVETPGSKILVNGIETGTYIVKRNYYFVMGDFFYNSLDSRHFGFIPENYIQSKLTMIYWSWDSSIPLTLLPRLIASIRWDRIGTEIK